MILKLILVCQLIFLINCIPIQDSDSRFHQAVNRTFLGFEKEKNLKWQGNFTFIQGADTQFGLIEFFKQNWTKTNNKWDEDLSLLNLAIQEWNSLSPPPKFVTICGDLVNDFPGENNRRVQLDDFKKSISKLNSNIPLILMGGNHDLLNTPTHDSISKYTEEFGDDYYSFWVGGVMFLVLNVQLYKNSTEVKDLYHAQDIWLEAQLKDAKESNYNHVIVLQHIPWFLRTIDDHAAEDEMWTIAMDERKRVVNKLYEAGIRFIFAGHYHQNAHGAYKELQMITSSAIGAQSPGGNAESGYRVVEISEKDIQHHYVNITRK